MSNLEAQLLLNQQIERVQDLLDGMVGLRSAWLGTERDKENADNGLMESLRAEQREFAVLRQRIYLMSLEEMQQIIETYNDQYQKERLERRAFMASRDQ